MKKSKWLMLIGIDIVLIIAILLWYFQIRKPYDDAVNAYNSVVTNIEQKNMELNALISDTQNLVNSTNIPFDEDYLFDIQMAIYDVSNCKRTINTIPQDKEDIILQTKLLSEPVDCSNVMQKLQDKKSKLETSIKQLQNPSQEFVMQRLKTISNISGMQAVTEDYDPNGKLNKLGGYTSTVYFASSQIDQDSISADPKYKNDIVGKGTECGGSIEVYATKEDAQQRNTYLATYDGGKLDTGSHKVVGTVVVRTSYKLTASQQKDLETRIINALIKL